MKKILVVSLGNALVPEDSLGIEIVRLLSPRLPDDVEVIEGGTDLLRVADQLHGRELIILIDTASTDQADAEWPMFLEHGSPNLDDAQHHAHHLSAVQALDLIRWSDESVRNARCVWFLVGARTG